jgi:hypothetical protein
VGFGGKKFFTVIDLKQGFNQFPLSARARKYMNMATKKEFFNSGLCHLDLRMTKCSFSTV